MLRSIGKQSGESVESVRKEGFAEKESLSLEWKSEGVMDNESGEFMELVNLYVAI